MEGFAPLEAPPPAATLRSAAYLCGCLLRLVQLTAGQAALPALPPASAAAAASIAAAAAAAVAAAGQGGGAEASGGPGMGPGGEGRPGFQERQFGSSPPAPRPPPFSWGLPSSPKGLGGAELLLGSEREGEKRPPPEPSCGASERPPVAAGGQGSGTRSRAAAAAPALGRDEAVLLASLVAAHLGPLCEAHEYVVCSAVLPMLLGAQEAGRCAACSALPCPAAAVAVPDCLLPAKAGVGLLLSCGRAYASGAPGQVLKRPALASLQMPSTFCAPKRAWVSPKKSVGVPPKKAWDY